jgi:hypothetical protein
VYSSTGAVARHETTPGTAAGIAAIAVAIDQLTAEVRANSGRPEHMKRVAEIWRMLASIDSDLARCIERYQTPAPGAQSAATAGTADGDSLP